MLASLLSSRAFDAAAFSTLLRCSVLRLHFSLSPLSRRIDWRLQAVVAVAAAVQVGAEAVAAAGAVVRPGVVLAAAAVVEAAPAVEEAAAA